MEKIATNIEQSKKLAEILPVESADLSYRPYCEEGMMSDYHLDLTPYVFASFISYPAWSLSALMNYLRKIDFFPYIDADEHEISMLINWHDDNDGVPLNPVHTIKVKAETFVDACVNLILKHKEAGVI